MNTNALVKYCSLCVTAAYIVLKSDREQNEVTEQWLLGRAHPRHTRVVLIVVFTYLSLKRVQHTWFVDESATAILMFDSHNLCTRLFEKFSFIFFMKAVRSMQLKFMVIKVVYFCYWFDWFIYFLFSFCVCFTTERRYPC